MKHGAGRVLITGGASGLGRALALQYAGAGREVLVLDRDRTAGQSLVDEVARRPGASDGVPSGPGKVRFAELDLADCEATRLGPVLGEALASGAPFDVVVCNAGISSSDDFLTTSRTHDETILNVNLIGHMQLLKALLTRGLIARRGRLGLVASATVYLPFPVALAYGASKAAVAGLAHALDPFLRGAKISVSCIYPGPLLTPHAEKYYRRFNEGKGADPRRVARRIVRGLDLRKRRIHPDLASGVFAFLAEFVPGLLAWIVHVKYREHMYTMPSGRTDAGGPTGTNSA